MQKVFDIEAFFTIEGQVVSGPGDKNFITILLFEMLVQDVLGIEAVY